MRTSSLAITACFLFACSSGADSERSEDGAMLAGIGDGEVSGGGSGFEGGATAATDPGVVTDDAAAGGARGPVAGATPSDPAAFPAGDVASGPAMSSESGTSIVAPTEPIADPVDPMEPIVPTSPVQPGTLTAGTWDDNMNFGRFMDYREEVFASQVDGLLPIEESEHVEVQELGMATPVPHDTLDIALVIDTTGSMGDELTYLQSEFSALSKSIEDLYPNSEQRWSLVVYRDEGDEYVTRWFDFRDDPEDFRTNLANQSAGGGGDYPEAPDAALEVMNQFAWRTGDSTARLAFWIGDAPHHAQNADALADAIRTSQNLGVHLYPVASSGVDELTELSMRSAAQMTGGRYLFLTDDSGVGGAHKEPTIPCYFVTQLDTAILRMVEIEMSGEHMEPNANDVIRTGGDPQDGACVLDSGESVFIF